MDSRFASTSLSMVRSMVSLSNHRGNDREGGGNDNGRADSSGIKFHIDPAMLQQLQNAAGFVPVIINIQPLRDLSVFLGINNQPLQNYRR